MDQSKSTFAIYIFMHALMLQSSYSYEPQGCLLVGDIEYIVELVDNTGEVVEQRVVTSDSCNNGTCSILIPPETCLAKVQATSPFGNSSTEVIHNGQVKIWSPKYTTVIMYLPVLNFTLCVITLAGGTRLTQNNRVLTIIGVLVLCIATASCAGRIIWRAVAKKGTDIIICLLIYYVYVGLWLSAVLLLVGCALMMVSVVIWLVHGGIVCGIATE